MKYVLAIALLVAVVAGAGAQSQPYRTQPAPRLPFLDWNACPFEGCVYRNWTTIAAVDVFDTWKTDRRQIATLPPKTSVTGLKGVVITYKPGVIRLNRDLSGDGLHRGDRILTYTYRGEGVWAVWFKGRFYPSFEIGFSPYGNGSGCGGNDCEAVYLDRGEKIWWAKVKTRSGTVGWVNMNQSKFSGTDMLASAAIWWRQAEHARFVAEKADGSSGASA